MTGKIGLRAAAAAVLAVTLSLAQDRSAFKVKVDVDMVVLTFQVTDNKGHYVNGLKPKDFKILEDGIQGLAGSEQVQVEHT